MLVNDPYIYILSDNHSFEDPARLFLTGLILCPVSFEWKDVQTWTRYRIYILDTEDTTCNTFSCPTFRGSPEPLTIFVLRATLSILYVVPV